MKTSILLLSGLLLTGSAIAQDLHTPADFIKIMTDSKVSYEMEVSDEEIPCKDRSENLNFNDSYRKTQGSSFTTEKYKIGENGKTAFEKAENFFTNSGNLDSARFYYELTVKHEPSFTKAVTYIGQTYGKQGKFDQAKKYYHQAISQNFIDYMAHWFVSDVYIREGKIKEAVDEVTIAHIMNRNNPRIQNSMDNIYKKANIKQNNWCFTPQMKLSSTRENKVRLTSNENWLGYALAQAVWKYEPGYRQSMGAGETTLSSTEARESVLSLYMGLKSRKVNLKKYPEFKTLEKAIENKMLDEYVVYEVILPQYPQAAYQLPEDFILSIKDYILKIRNS